jgi:hypothetical protein
VTVISDLKRYFYDIGFSTYVNFSSKVLAFKEKNSKANLIDLRFA